MATGDGIDSIEMDSVLASKPTDYVAGSSSQQSKSSPVDDGEYLYWQLLSSGGGRIRWRIMAQTMDNGLCDCILLRMFVLHNRISTLCKHWPATGRQYVDWNHDWISLPYFVYLLSADTLNIFIFETTYAIQSSHKCVCCFTRTAAVKNIALAAGLCWMKTFVFP